MTRESRARTFGKEKIGAFALEVVGARRLLAVGTAALGAGLWGREASGLVGVPSRSDAPSILLEDIEP